MIAASPAPDRLVLDAVSRRFGARLVVDTVSFAARANAVTILVGPSGCGKTTLLRMIAGIERPSGGRILIDGREVAGPSRFVVPERRRVGLMFQDYALFPHLTALDNVMFGLGAFARAERRRLAEEALERVGLTRHAGDRPARLSGGEQQRLALARALAPSPHILLMDEPFSNLDRGLRAEVRERTLSVLRAAEATAILVTHDPEEALAIGDHLVLLAEGRVIQAGPAANLYSRPSSIAAARALSPVNLVPGTVEGGILRTPLGERPAPGAPAGTAALVAFRPEELTLGPAGTGLRGRIETRTFQGASTLLGVSVPGLSEHLQISIPTDGLPDQPEVGIRAERGLGAAFSPADGRALEAEWEV